MTTPNVSVVTISFRDPDGLRRTIDSVRRQDHPTIEHVVIDGGSGPEVASMLADTGTLAYWQSQPDAGRYDAMNIGLARSTGDIVWFMHSGDTFFSPRSVSDAVEAVGSPAPGWWAHGLARLVDTSGREHGVMGEGGFSLARFEAGGHPIPHQAALFHRALFEAVGVYDVDIGLAADQEFMLRAALRSAPLFVDEILCDFDVSGSGSTRGVHPHFVDMRRAVRTHVARSAPRRVIYLARSYMVEARVHAAFARRRLREARRNR